MDHIEHRQIAAYWTGSLPPDELLRLDAHLPQCPSCRDMLQAAAPAAGPQIEPLADPHLEYADLAAYVDSKLTAERRAIVTQHLAVCADCRAEADDLGRFRAEWNRRPRRSWMMPAAIAASLLLATLALWRFTRIEPVTYTASIQDNGRVIGLDRNGNLIAPAAITGAEAQQMKALLATGAMVLTPPPSALRPPATTFLGQPAADSAFTITSPIGHIVLDDKPIFAWTALPGAATYRVQVLDENYQPVIESPAVSALQWQPAQALPRGRILAWQVVANRSGATVRTPQPPQPEARFTIASQPLADRIAAASQLRPVSHLQLAILYAQSGLAEECAEALAALAAENPDSPLVRRWQEELRRQSAPPAK